MSESEETLNAFIKRNHNEALTWIDRIEHLLNDERFQFAEETLNGIMSSIESADKVTEGQKEAIKNIEDSVYERR